MKYVFAGNGEERRSGEPPLGRSAGLLNNKQQFFILLGRNNTAIYPTSFNREKKKKLDNQYHAEFDLFDPFPYYVYLTWKFISESIVTLQV